LKMLLTIVVNPFTEGANMADYMKSTPEGLSVVDFSGLTRVALILR
jgi:hypothetical protein